MIIAVVAITTIYLPPSSPQRQKSPPQQQQQQQSPQNPQQSLLLTQQQFDYNIITTKSPTPQPDHHLQHHLHQHQHQHQHSYIIFLPYRTAILPAVHPSILPFTLSSPSMIIITSHHATVLPPSPRLPWHSCDYSVVPRFPMQPFIHPSFHSTFLR